MKKVILTSIIMTVSVLALSIYPTTALAEEITGNPGENASVGSDRWSTDVEVNSHGDVIQVHLNQHRPTGNLFAVLIHEPSPGTFFLSHNFSDDGGATWTEKSYYEVSSDIVATSVIGNYFIIVYYKPLNDELRCVCRLAEYGSGGGSYIIANHDCTGLAITSDHDFLDNNLYLMVNTPTGSVCYNSNTGTTWLPFSFIGLPTDVNRGMDMVSPKSWCIYFSYISNSNYIKIYSFKDIVTGWLLRYSQPVFGSPPEFTSISAWHDTVLCAFEVAGDAVITAWSGNGGSSWDNASLSQFDDMVYEPAVTLAMGQGIGVAYRLQITSPFPLAFTRFKHGSYDDNSLTGNSSDLLSDSKPRSVQPAIECLNSGMYGVIYAKAGTPRTAWFDSGPSCCVGNRGNVDGDGNDAVNVGDLSYLVSYLFDQPPGPAPPCFEEADVDASGSINVGDLSYLVSYLFDQPPGPAPLACP